MITKFIVCLLIFFTLILPAYAEDAPAFSGEIKFSFEGREYVFSDLPMFEDYPAAKPPSGKMASDIDFSSHENAWLYRTRLRAGLKKGANYNRHYAVVMHGCGTECQVNWVVDVTTGKVAGNFTTSAGAAFRKDSALIIGDLRDGETIKDLMEANALYGREMAFYLVEKGQPKTLRVIDFYKEIDTQR